MTSMPPVAPAHTAAERSTHAPTLGRMLLAAAERHQGCALRAPQGGSMRSWSYAELGARARATARGLIALGVEPGDRVGILGTTTPDWTLADAGALTAGATVVPVYHTNSPEECAYVLGHSESKVVLCEDAAQVAKIAAVRDQLPALEHVVAFGGAAGALAMDELIGGGERVAPDRVEQTLLRVAPHDIATIVYTSGTTGPPKGCAISHGNFLAAMHMYERALELRDDVVIFMFLPLAHVLARIVQVVTLDVGGTLAFASGSRDALLDELQELAPTHVPAVPRVFEKIRTRALAQAAEGGELREAIFRRALATGARTRRAERDGRRLSPAERARFALADRLALHKVRGLFGDRLDVALTGAAPMGRDVLEFFDACGVLILEGYGMSETTAAATLNVPEAFRFGTVGRALEDSRVRIADDGEVMMAGPHIFGGYYRDPESTAEVLRDGWLASGDLGEIDGDGYLRITGRKKDLIITSSGKNVTPANIEAGLRDSRWISQAIVQGDNRSYLVALLTLDPEEAPALAAKLGISGDVEALATHPAVRAELQAHVDAVNRQFARIEQIKRFAILPRDLSQEAGEMTPTMKVKRNVVAQRYAGVIEGLYA